MSNNPHRPFFPDEEEGEFRNSRRTGGPRLPKRGPEPEEGPRRGRRRPWDEEEDVVFRFDGDLDDEEFDGDLDDDLDDEDFEDFDDEEDFEDEDDPDYRDEEY